MNSVHLIGRIANELELKWLPSGQHCTCEFNLAVNRPRQKDKEQEADFIRIVVWNKQAENLVKFQNKGSQIGAVGRIRVESYTDQQGAKKSITKIVASEVEFLSSKKSENEPKQQIQQAPFNQQQEYSTFMSDYSSSINITDEDLPF